MHSSRSGVALGVGFTDRTRSAHTRLRRAPDIRCVEAQPSQVARGSAPAHGRTGAAGGDVSDLGIPTGEPVGRGDREEDRPPESRSGHTVYVPTSEIAPPAGGKRRGTLPWYVLSGLGPQQASVPPAGSKAQS